jgi:hypothetical protein
LKDFIIQNIYEPGVAFNEWFLVKAENKKDAINKVYEQYGFEFRKKDFKAYTLTEFYQMGDESVVSIH